MSAPTNQWAAAGSQWSAAAGGTSGTATQQTGGTSSSVNQWALATQLGGAASGGSAGGWAATTQMGRSANGGSGWGQLVPPPVSNPMATHQVVALSQGMIMEGGAGGGALSVSTHNKQMQIVEASLNEMMISVHGNLKQVLVTIQKFVTRVNAANDEIGVYCGAIIRRGIHNDPTLTGDDLAKANAIVLFTKTSVESMGTMSNLALETIKNGGSVITQQTLGALNVIFEARTKQVALFAQKIEIFRAQEKHDLEVMLKIEEANLKSQAQAFNQMVEIRKLAGEEQQAEFTQHLELQKLDLEQQVQFQELSIKAAEVRLTAQNKSDEISALKEIESEKTRVMHEIERHKTERAAEVAKKQSQDKKETDIHAADRAKEVAVQESKDRKDAAMWDSTTSIFKVSSCSVM